MSNKIFISKIIYLITLLSVLFCITGTLVFYCLYQDATLNTYVLKIGFLILLFSTVFFLINLKMNNYGQYFLFSLIFIFCFMIVHLQLYVDYLLGKSLPLIMPMFDITSIGINGFLISIISIQSFYLGYFVALKFLKRRNFSLNHQRALKSFNLQLVIISILFLLFIFMSDFNYFRGGYGSIKNTPIAAFIEYLLKLSFIAYLISYSVWFRANKQKNDINQYLKYFNKIILITIFIYFLLVFSSGDRGPVIQITMGIVLSYLYGSCSKLSLVKLIIIGVLSVSTLFTIGISRKYVGESNLSFSKLIKTIEGISSSSRILSVSPLTAEYAMSLRAFHGGFEYVKNNGFRYGELNFYSLLGMMPGLGRIYQWITNQPLRELQSSAIITDDLNAEFGLGTTCLIDIYMDFGFLGCIIVFIAFGFFARRIDEFIIFSQKMTLFATVLSFMFIIYSYYIPRSTITSIFRDSVMVYLYFQFFRLVLISKRKNILKV
ncbi:hypothetical protein DSCO28_08280 [Desulfosarcina ovata subsp. sediminis]|uniref:O-antigen polysaccharide polymerase Wzy n=1 Tax=Desulfosarcina ovata subsp. sediminis TaxID=885957 RepID=A0A5K7ZE19_9BACT|nr:O-antigen polymerase [Desulfosarcina ovata]BBO80262.1 hypothetical protein DSCO28_08280 [Desulfosarcina ovata subsp. sediminis]